MSVSRVPQWKIERVVDLKVRLGLPKPMIAERLGLREKQVKQIWQEARRANPSLKAAKLYRPDL